MAFVYFDSRYAPCGFLIVADGGDPYAESALLIQSDWDFPGVASRMGWSPCHDGTDGTVACAACGNTAGELISAAIDHIREREGEEFPELDDYFPEAA